MAAEQLREPHHVPESWPQMAHVELNDSMSGVGSCTGPLSAPAHFRRGGAAVARLGQELLAEVWGPPAGTRTARAGAHFVWRLAREVSELKSRVAAIEERDTAVAEAQRKHEEAIHAEMREAGFDPDAPREKALPPLSQAVWDAILEEA